MLDAGAAVHPARAERGRGQVGDRWRSAAHCAGDASGVDRAPRAAAAADDAAHIARSVIFILPREAGKGDHRCAQREGWWKGRR